MPFLILCFSFESDVATVNGKTIKITTSNGVVVNMSKVTATDIDASNGVIHVIDSVLMPK